MTVNAKQLHAILISAIVLVIGGSTALTFYSLSSMSNRSERLVATKLDTAEINASRELELKHRAELIKNQANIEMLQKIVPKSKDQALAVAELLNIAKDNDLTIGSVTFPASELGVNVKATGSTGTVTQTKPVEGLSGILGIELTISQLNRAGSAPGAGITYSQLIKTLESIEKNRRTMQIKNIQVQPIMKLNTVIGYNPTITINLFVKQ